MTMVAELHARWMRDDAEYRAAYEALADEFPETEPHAAYEALEWRDNRLEPITAPRATERPQSDQKGPAEAQD